MNTTEMDTTQKKQLESLLTQLQCAICFDIMDPIVLESQCCQVLVCGICALRCKSCPNCRNSPVSWKRNVALQRIIGNLPTNCIFCSHSTTRSELNAHKKTCKLATFKCRFGKCTERRLRSELSAHEKTCRFRPVNCPDCNEPVISYQMALHKSSACKNRQVYCSSCGDKTVFHLIQEHSQSLCKQRAVQCDNCHDFVIVSEMNEHHCKRVADEPEQVRPVKKRKSCSCKTTKCEGNRCGCLFGCNQNCACMKTETTSCKNTNTRTTTTTSA